MAWRETMLRAFGPGIMGGVTFGRWCRLLAQNHFRVSPSCLPRAITVTAQSLQNSVNCWLDNRRIGSELDEISVPAPLFVLGHWRSGTTLLHNLLTTDNRFAYPNNYQSLFPFSFLTAESLHSKVVEFLLPKTRPMDNVEWDMQSPQEDEFALAIMTFMSPCMGWVFPGRRDEYDKYLTLRGVPDEDVREWKAGLMGFLKKLTWKHRRPLILKSPPHTCRIRLLRSLFPDAKFVHIHRDPYVVFSSSKRTFLENFRWHCLQRPKTDDVDDWIIRQYRAMYEAFFEERELIPKGHYHDLSFEELEGNPIGRIQRIYEALGLPEFSVMRASLEKFLATIEGYKKNEYPELPVDLRERIAAEWKFCFDEWGYAS